MPSMPQFHHYEHLLTLKDLLLEQDDDEDEQDPDLLLYTDLLINFN
jgi:hypothetical protein